MDITTHAGERFFGLGRGAGSNASPDASVMTEKPTTPREVACPRCQSLIATDYRYCGFCGHFMPSDTKRWIRRLAMRALSVRGARPEPIDRRLA